MVGSGWPAINYRLGSREWGRCYYYLLDLACCRWGLRLGSWRRHLKVSSRSTGSEFLLPGMREKAGKFSNFFLSLMMSILTKTVLKRLALIYFHWHAFNSNWVQWLNFLLAGRLAVPVPWTEADRWRRPSYCIVFELKCWHEGGELFYY